MAKIKRQSDLTSRKFKLRVCHVSDNHSAFYKLNNRFDAVVFSGDFFPNSIAVMNKNIQQETSFQMRWLEENLSSIKKWLNGHPFLFILGNHDFLHPALMAQALCAENIDAINLTNQVVEYEGITFYGFPYIPYISGWWNYEKEIPEMQIEVDKMIDVFNSKKIDVLVSHAPLYQTLDLSNGNDCIGSTVLNNALDYKINKCMLPKYILHGHLHENNGVALRNNILISNAATSQNIIEMS